MNKLNVFKHALVGLTILFAATLLHADETQPKFTIIPSTHTKWVIPSNGNAKVIYTVTNQTKITRTLTMKPIPGITQKTTGFGVCDSTFTLAHGQSCQLVLPLVGSQLSGHITGGPVVCKTKGHGDNSPDPFLCSQACGANSLDILSVGFEPASISVNPTVLEMIVGPFGLPSSSTLTVTNNSQTVTAFNITAHLPASWATVGNASNCGTLAPGGTCQITLTQGNVLLAPEQIPVFGTNTTQVLVSMAVVEGIAKLSSSPLSLILVNGGVPQNVTVTNISTVGAVAHNVVAYLPNALSSVGVTALPVGCVTLNPGASCIITFTPPALGDAVVPADGSYLPVPIYGDNTTDAPVNVKLENLQASIAVTSPHNLHFLQEDPTTQSFTVKNVTSSTNVTATADNILATTTANFNASQLNTLGKVQLLGSSTCTNTLNKGISCTFNFKAIPGGGTIPPTSFDIEGTNTNKIPVTISVSNQKLSWSNSTLVSSTSSVLATQGIFTAASGAGSSSGTTLSKSRTLTVYNIGTDTANNVLLSVVSPLPAGTTISPTSCGAIAAGGSCVLTITPGNTPSSNPPSEPTASEIMVSGDFTNELTADITLLTYMNRYKGGNVFSIDDSYPANSSVGGTIVLTIPSETPLPWWPTGSCDGTVDCRAVVTTFTDGSINTLNIIARAAASTQDYAALFCSKVSNPSFTTSPVYLPAGCQLGYGQRFGALCGTQNKPSQQNITSNANSRMGAYWYWSSTGAYSTTSVSAYAYSGYYFDFAVFNKENIARLYFCVQDF